MEQADVVVPAPRGGLVQADGDDGGEILLGARTLDVVIQGAPHAHVADGEQLRHLAHRHRLAQGNNQGLHQLCEAAAGAGPRRRDLGGLGAGVAAHPRHLGVDICLELEEVQMAPLPFLGVVDRLVLGPAARADKACPRREGHLKIDAPDGRVEGDIDHLPRRLQAQCDGKQRGRIHGDTPRESACGLVDESYGPARALRDLWTTHGPRRRPPVQSVSPDPGAAHRLPTLSGLSPTGPTGTTTGSTKCVLRSPSDGAHRCGGKPGYPHQT